MTCCSQHQLLPVTCRSSRCISIHRLTFLVTIPSNFPIHFSPSIPSITFSRVSKHLSASSNIIIIYLPVSGRSSRQTHRVSILSPTQPVALWPFKQDTPLYSCESCFILLLLPASDPHPRETTIIGSNEKECAKCGQVMTAEKQLYF